MKDYICFPEGHNYEDIDTTYQVFDLCSRVCFVDQPLYLHRKRPGSITQTGTRKNLEDRNLACEHLEAFVESHIPEVFSEKHLQKLRQARLAGLVNFFVAGNIGTEEIRGAFAEVKLKNSSTRFKMTSWIVRFCPSLLRILYPVYRPLRMLVWEGFRR